MIVLKLIAGLLVSAGFAYFLGSLNSAIIVCRIAKGEDIRKFGSNNAGLTNVIRTFGKKLAVITLVCDLAKGVVAVTFARLVVGKLMGVTILGDELFVCYVAAFFVMMGHVYPVYYGFKGGKGVLVAATSLLAVDPISCVLALLIFAAIFYFSRYVSLSSIFSSLSFPVLTIVTQSARGYDSYAINAVMVFAMSLVIVYKHRPNIQRLNEGTESRFKSKKQKDS